MLTSTFCHLPGVGAKTERKLWSAGVLSWQHALGVLPGPLHRPRLEEVRARVQESVRSLQKRDARYFADRLPSAEQWRLFPEFRDGVAYLDIETTGLGPPYDHITTIALYDGLSLRHYVYDDNLADFVEDVADYQLLVTYNGKAFDVPFIRACLGAPMRQAHIDLRYVLASLGVKGGLKGCERHFGLDRGDLAGVDGYFAVLLWQDYVRNGNEGALQSLLAYNAQDTLNLETLMVRAYNMKLAGTPFSGARRLPLPTTPHNPFTADLETLDRIRRQMLAVGGLHG